jgi:hypothetical protein
LKSTVFQLILRGMAAFPQLSAEESAGASDGASGNRGEELKTAHGRSSTSLMEWTSA